MADAKQLLLENFQSEFCQIVANHIQDHLNPSEWEQLLALAQSGIPHSPELSFTAFDSIERRVRHLTFIENISPLEMLSAPHFYQRLQIIGTLHGQPVCYFSGSGIYQWSLTPDGDSLSFWLTYPVYPPGWPNDDNLDLPFQLQGSEFDLKWLM
ncbi:hypothetical protein [Chromobacterium vaccinii]|uniref:hypothetical protein n=1 Tax=Chromobacterium vaccinii TaxID=1108595 RepID=UPI000B071705|nr:hypothetical protein [Chromobacterium vaccinii]QND85887.1 Uncharacterized protein ChrSW_3661 [Chromobacterium vaccinii]QND91118.1 Uncharacterized protein ChrSV_3661 [Chromobacterium vaccinii]